jgi:hypothetical protein
MGNFGSVASLLAATLYQENTDYGIKMLFSWNFA